MLSGMKDIRQLPGPSEQEPACLRGVVDLPDDSEGLVDGSVNLFTFACGKFGRGSKDDGVDFNASLMFFGNVVRGPRVNAQHSSPLSSAVNRSFSNVCQLATDLTIMIRPGRY